MNKILLPTILLLTALVAGAQAATKTVSMEPSQAQPANRDNKVATSFSADCICDQGNGYLNAHAHQIPYRPESYKPGTIITVSANSCRHLSACSVRALTGTYRMKIDSWNSNTAYVYKFTINGPQQ